MAVNLSGFANNAVQDGLRRKKSSQVLIVHGTTFPKDPI